MDPKAAEIIQVNLRLVAMVRALAQEVQQVRGDRDDQVHEVELVAKQANLLWREYSEVRDRKDQQLDQKKREIAILTDAFLKEQERADQHSRDAGRWHKFLVDQQPEAEKLYCLQRAFKATAVTEMAISDTQECPACKKPHLTPDGGGFACGYCGAGTFCLGFRKPGDPPF